MIDSIFSALTKTVTLPIDLLKDSAEALENSLNDEPLTPHTSQKLNSIKQDIKNLF